MVNIDFGNLNPLEQQINKKLTEYAKKHNTIRIEKAADICGCSISKISKFVKKLGFENYKQYLTFLQGQDIEDGKSSSELMRIRDYIDDFNEDIADELFELIKSHEKIVMFGYGPSLLCAQYFEYRLRIFTAKTVLAVTDSLFVSSMTDENTLLLLFTATGTFKSFQDLYRSAKEKGSDVVIISEEYNTELFNQCDRVLWLSDYPQPAYLKPYEKSRTVFFIFIEEVIQRFLREKLADENGEG